MAGRALLLNEQQHGVAVPESAIRSAQTRAMLASEDAVLTAAAHQRVRVGYTMIDATDAEALPLKEQLTRFGPFLDYNANAQREALKTAILGSPDG